MTLITHVGFLRSLSVFSYENSFVIVVMLFLAAFDFDTLMETLESLEKRIPVDIPKYDFMKNNRLVRARNFYILLFEMV